MKSDAKEICQMVKNSHSAMLSNKQKKTKKTHILDLLNTVSTSIDPSFSV